MLSWLVQGFERMVPQPEVLKKLEVSTAQCRRLWGCWADVTVEWAPCLHPTCPGWNPGEENPWGIEQSRKEALGCVLLLLSLTASSRTLHLGPAGTSSQVSGLNGPCQGNEAKTAVEGVWGCAHGSPWGRGRAHPG